MIVTAIVAIFAGILFGLGLSISGMTNPDRVRGFLDVAGGSWDPSLMFVLGGAVSVTVISFRFVFRCAEPTCAASFELPKKTRVDGKQGRTWGGSWSRVPGVPIREGRA